METRDLAGEGQRLRARYTLALAVVHVVAVLAGILVSWVMAGERFPSPFVPRPSADAYFIAHPAALMVLGFFQLFAAMPLGAFAASLATDMRSLGAADRTVHLTLFAGIGASVFQAAAGCALWVISQPGVAEIPAVTRPLHLFSFAAGGPACLASLGVLVAVVTASGRNRGLPQWLKRAGDATAAAALLSIVTLVGFGGVYLALIARLACLAWMIAVAVFLCRDRAAA